MSNRSRDGEGLTEVDGSVTRLSLPCGHEGPFETSHTARGRTHYKCPSCGRIYAEDPHRREEREYSRLASFEETVDKADKGLRTLLDQAAKNIDYIAGKRDCLKEADKIINGERQDSYGAPEDSFTIIAGYWNVFLAAKLKALGIDVKDLLSPLDTTNMMVLFKQARKLGQKPSRDNYVDSCGYEAIGADRLSE